MKTISPSLTKEMQKQFQPKDIVEYFNKLAEGTMEEGTFAEKKEMLQYLITTSGYEETTAVGATNSIGLPMAGAQPSVDPVKELDANYEETKEEEIQPEIITKEEVGEDYPGGYVMDGEHVVDSDPE